MKLKRNTRRTITLALISAFPLVLIGCSSGGPSHAGGINSIRWDPSPAMHTLDRRYSDSLNNYARVKDTNTRMIANDVHKIFFLDRPSRLYKGVKP